MSMIGALLAVTALASPAQATQPVGLNAQDAQVTNTLYEVGLDWADRPLRNAVETSAPLFMPDVGPRNPEVRLVCTARANGRLDCESAQRDNDAFNPAAQRVMARTRVKAVDGGSAEGRQFAFTIRFGLPRRLTQLTASSIQ
jgi:hypothetical protein